jgi:hypothetical protein
MCFEDGALNPRRVDLCKVTSPMLACQGRAFTGAAA